MPSAHVELRLNDIPADAETVTLWRVDRRRATKVRGFVSRSRYGVLLGRDFEAGFGRELEYYAEFYTATGAVLAVTQRVAVVLPMALRGSIVVHDALRPKAPVTLRLESTAVSALSRATESTRVRVPGRSAPVSLGGTRAGLAGLVLDGFTRTTADADTLWTVLGDYDADSSGVIVVRPSPDIPLPGTLFLAFDDVSAVPIDAPNGDDATLWRLAGDEVAPPAPAVVEALVTYDAIADYCRRERIGYAGLTARFPSYSALVAAFEFGDLA